MADLKISEMTPAAELTGDELIECVQGGVNVKQELTGLKTWVNNGVQPSSSTLDALSSFNTNGIMVQTDTSEFIGRTITGTASQVTVTNGDGVSGNPTISLAASGVTAGTYGSSSAIPVPVVDTYGRITGITTAAVVSPTVFSDSAFRIQDNDNATKQLAFEVSGVAADATSTITVPNANINLGNLSSVATTDLNTLSGTRNRILGGSGNNVSGTDNIVIAGSNCTINGIGNTVLGGELCDANTKQGTRLLGRKAIAYTDFEQVDCIYYGTAHSGGARQFYDRFAPNIRTYNTYMFGDISDLSVQNAYSLAFKPKAVIGLASSVEPAAAFHKIRIVALKMDGAAGAASMEVSLMCRSLDGVYTIVERVNSAVVGTAGIMGTFTFSIDSSGYLIIQKVAQSADWGYFIYGKAYHTATQ